MRFWSAAVALVMATSVCGRETVCMNPGANSPAIYRARGIAARILKEANVQVEFKDDERFCAALGNAITITVSVQTPDNLHPGALAYAMPFERSRVVVFYDRILSSVKSDAVPILLGHVLAHEVAHMLEAAEHHSSSGVMKQKWDYRDYVEMQRKPLRFTEEDLLLIRRGMQVRAARRGSSSQAVQ